MDDVSRFEEFFRDRCYNELMKAVSEDKSVVIDFSLIDRFDPILADQLLESPENILESMEKAAYNTVSAKVRVRVHNLPESRSVRIRDLRAKHIGKLWTIDTIIKSATEVKPQIYEVEFECPRCGTHINYEQDSNLVQKPVACDCGNRGDFKLIEKKMMDTRWLNGMEPFDLTMGEKPGEVNIFLKEDLTTPRLQKKSDPGARLKFTGIVRELPKRIKGKLSTKMDIYLDTVYFETNELDFEELEITKEDEIRIQELANDPNIYEKLKMSIAPGIFGFDEIKEAVCLQLFGGIQHKLPDGTHIRGNIHILVTGDPGVGKSLVGSSKVLCINKDKPEYTTIGSIVDEMLKNNKVKINDSEIAYSNDIKILSINPKSHKSEWKTVSSFIRHESPKKLIKVKTKSGREIIATKDHSFVHMNSFGDIVSIKGSELNSNIYFPISLSNYKQLISEIETGEQIKRTNARLLPEKIKLSWNFGFFVGLFLSEGSILGNSRVSISSMNKERIEPIKKLIKEIGLEFYETETSIDMPSKRLVEFMNNYCYMGEKTKAGKGSGAMRKSMPDFSFCSPLDYVYGMLSGIFSGDGYFVNVKPSKGRTEGNLKIGFASISRNLAYGILELLSLIGIFSSIREKKYIYRKEARICYEITILGRYAENFVKTIKMIGKPVPSITRFSEKDFFDSLPCCELLYSAVKELGYSKKSHIDSKKRRSFAAMMRTVKKRNKIGRRRLERVIEELKKEAEIQKNEKAKGMISKLISISNSSLIWDQVKNVEEIKSEEKYVYDFSVDGNENFEANNLIVHNSVLLKLVSSVVPRGKYVSGSGVSGAGLTATVRKDENLGTWVLEAGALILCNKGLIAIDEFDKMSKDDQIAMHEATSVETVSVAKASIIATLPAQTAVLAGANPKYGRFDPFRSIGEQIMIPDTLLSRFDLKFALRDRPSIEKDADLAEHIIMSRTNPEMIEPLIDRNMLRKFIAYAKQTKDLILPQDVAHKLKDYYVKMRNSNYSEEVNTISITLRQYEALLRLAEASAKIRLSKIIEMSDADRAVRLMEYSLQQLGYDRESGQIDIDKMEGGMPSSKRKKITSVIEIVEKMQKEMKEIPIDTLKAQCESIGVKDFDNIIDQLKREGTVFEPRPGYVRKT